MIELPRAFGAMNRLLPNESQVAGADVQLSCSRTFLSHSPFLNSD